jgi:hypothetical protein
VRHRLLREGMLSGTQSEHCGRRVVVIRRNSLQR